MAWLVVKQGPGRETTDAAERYCDRECAMRARTGQDSGNDGDTAEMRKMGQRDEKGDSTEK